MNEVFEKIIEKLEEEKMSYFLTIANTGDEKLDCAYEQVGDALDKAIEIVKQEAEQYDNGRIPCSSGVLPKRPNSYYVTKMCETEKLLSNKNSRQKRNKHNTKCIKVLAKNYNEAIQLLKDKGLLYET